MGTFIETDEREELAIFINMVARAAGGAFPEKLDLTAGLRDW